MGARRTEALDRAWHWADAAHDLANEARHGTEGEDAFSTAALMAQISRAFSAVASAMEESDELGGQDEDDGPVSDTFLT
jgi:hypothetical protein